MIYAFNCSTWGVKAGRSLYVPCQPSPYREFYTSQGYLYKVPLNFSVGNYWQTHSGQNLSMSADTFFSLEKDLKKFLFTPFYSYFI